MTRLQEKLVVRYCELKGWEIAEVVRETGRAGRGAGPRPGLRRAMSLLCEGDALVAAYGDRLERGSVRVAGILAEARSKGAEVHLAIAGRVA